MLSTLLDITQMISISDQSLIVVMSVLQQLFRQNIRDLKLWHLMSKFVSVTTKWRDIDQNSLLQVAWDSLSINVHDVAILTITLSIISRLCANWESFERSTMNASLLMVIMNKYSHDMGIITETSKVLV
jgi:hypothetical protein